MSQVVWTIRTESVPLTSTQCCKQRYLVFSQRMECENISATTKAWSKLSTDTTCFLLECCKKKNKGKKIKERRNDSSKEAVLIESCLCFFELLTSQDCFPSCSVFYGVINIIDYVSKAALSSCDVNEPLWSKFRPLCSLVFGLWISQTLKLFGGGYFNLVSPTVVNYMVTF